MMYRIYQWVLRCLAVVFDRGAAFPPLWIGQPLLSSNDTSTAVIWLAGLSSNGHRRSSSAINALFEQLHGNYSIYSRNLWGHSGRYEDFRRSRMWHWVSDMKQFSRELLSSGRHSQLVYVADSTAALVVAVTARWLLRNHGDDSLLGIVYIVPAWRLKSRKNETLLALALTFYYVLAPVMLFLVAWRIHWLWPLSLACWVITLLVFPKIWVPNGDAFAARQRFGSKWSELLTVGSCFFCGLTPLTIAVASHYISAEWTAVCLTTFLVLLVLPLTLTRRNRDVDESCEALVYNWLPVITTSTMLLLQWAARGHVRKLKVPAMVILAEQDEVVDNTVARALYERIGSDTKRIEHVPCGHSDWPEEVQLHAASIIADWLHTRAAQAAAA